MKEILLVQEGLGGIVSTHLWTWLMYFVFQSRSCGGQGMRILIMCNTIIFIGYGSPAAEVGTRRHKLM